MIESIKVLLSDGLELENRFGMQRFRIGQPEGLPILSSYRLQQFRYDFKRPRMDDHPSVGTANESRWVQGSSRPQTDVNVGPESHKQKATLKAKFCWAVRDKQKFGSLIQHLTELVRGLNAIVPVMPLVSLKLLQQDVRHVERISRLELLMEGSKDHDQPELFTVVIQEQIDGRCQQRILESLWYNMIDHRRNSVSEPHPGTFDWAPNPPTDQAKWDNLFQWLQSGCGIYWIHGKPGSGKTTLMKYICDYPMTRSLLLE